MARDRTWTQRRRLVALTGLLWGGCLMTSCVNLPGIEPVEGAVRLSDKNTNDASMPLSASLPLTVDNNRVFAEVVFRRHDGSERKALAWVNMGMAALSITPSLEKDLGQDGPVHLVMAGLPVVVDRKAVVSAPAADFAQQLGPMPVEATVPAGVLSQFCVNLNYQKRVLKLMRACAAPPSSIAVPLHVNRATGIASVDAVVEGRPFPVVIDSGGGYTWWRGDRVRELASAHPDIVRAEGAVGESNQAMLDQPFELQATIVRLPAISLGSLQIKDAGVLGSGPARGGLVSPVVGDLFWSAWEKGAGRPVVGWIGGNVLRDYDITIDYARAVSYWRPVAAARTDDLNSVGLSLVHSPNGYVVGGVVTRDGTRSIEGAEVGDRLVSIDERDVSGMTRGAVISALHGKPGDRRRLVLERGARQFDVDAVVGDY